jgi:hypothetical protein
MTTPTATREAGHEHRAELIALIAAATLDFTTTWRQLTRAQDLLLRRLEQIRPGRGATALTRAAVLDFNQQVGAFERAARALTERWAATDLPTAYRDGAWRALRSLDWPLRLFAWTPAHQAAITGITATYYADLISRVTEAVRRAHAFARAAQDQARAHTGVDTPTLLADHPLGSVVYSNQARHPVRDWARSALSWQAVTTTNSGAINLARLDLDVQWMQVTDGPGCGWTQHGDIDHAAGTIRSVDECSLYPSAHHGCIRAFIPRPDLNGLPDLEGMPI